MENNSQQNTTNTGNKESKQWLYNKMTAAGYNVGKDYDAFDAALKNQESRDWLYKKAKTIGLNVGDSITFNKLMGYGDIEPENKKDTSVAQNISTDEALGDTSLLKKTQTQKPEVSQVGNAHVPTAVPFAPTLEDEKASQDKFKNDMNTAMGAQVFTQPTTDYEAAMHQSVNSDMKQSDIAVEHARNWAQYTEEGKAALKKAEDEYANNEKVFIEAFQKDKEYADIIGKYRALQQQDPEYQAIAKRYQALRNSREFADIKRKYEDLQKNDPDIATARSKYQIMVNSKRLTPEQANEQFNEEANKIFTDKYGKQYNDELNQAFNDKYGKQFSDETNALFNNKYGEQMNQELATAFSNKYGADLERERENAFRGYEEEAMKNWSYGRISDETFGRKAAKSQNDDLLTRIDNELNTRIEQVRNEELQKEKESGLGYKIGKTLYASENGYTPDNTKLIERTSLLHAARDYVKDANEMIAAVEENKGFGAAMGGTLADVDTWDFGMTQLLNSAALKQAAEKADKGEKLTSDEELLLESAANYMAVSMYYSDKLGRWYKAGQTTAASIPFMLQFMLTGGAESAATNAITRGLYKYALKAAQKGGRKLAKKSITNTAIKTGTKFAGTAIADLGYSAGMTAVFSPLKVAEGVKSRMTGTILPQMKETEDGFDYAGRVEGSQQGLGEALWNSSFSEFTENFSEVFFNPFKVLKPTRALIQSSKTLGQLATKVEGNTLVQTIRHIASNPYLAEIRQLTKFGGLYEEFMEEEVGGALKLAFTTDTDMEQAGFTLDGQIDTILGVGPSVVAMGYGSRAIYYGAYAKDMAALKKTMSDQQKQAFKNIMSESRSGEFGRKAHDYLRNVIMDSSLSESDKKAIIYSVVNKYKDLLNNDLIQEAAQAGQETREQRITEHYEQFANTTSGYLEHAIILGDDQTTRSYIKKGKVVYDEDGKIDLSKSDKSCVVVTESADGNKTVRQIPTKNILTVVNQGTVEVNAAEDIYQSRIQFQAQQLFPEGSLVTVPNSNGATSQVHYDTNGNILIDTDGGQVMFTPEQAIDQLVPVQTTENTEEETNGETPAEENNATPNEETSIDDGAINPAPTTERVTFVRNGTTITTEKEGDNYYLIGENGQRSGRPFTLQVLQDAGYEQQQEPTEPTNEESVSTEPTNSEIANEQLTPEQTSAEDNTQEIDITSPKVIGTNKYGNIYQWVLGKAKEAAKFLCKNKGGYLKGVFHRDDIGDIDLAWGNAKAGLQHIIRRHIEEQDDFDSVNEAIEAISNTIQNGNVRKEDNSYVVEYGNMRVIVSSDGNGNWIVTAYDYVVSQEDKKRKDAAALGTPSQPNDGAGAVAPNLSNGKGTENNSTPQENSEEKVPDVTEDNAQAARERGFRMENGHRIDRQDPIGDKVVGRETSIAFGSEKKDQVPARYTLIDASALQPSHRNGVRNRQFFIDEAQPKERTDQVSVVKAQQMAQQIRPEEITTGATAYTGTPIINARGEVIQGNNRTAALKEMYDNHPQSVEQYKQYLREHATEYGLTAEAIDQIEHPVLVRIADVSDSEAIRLGNMTAQDLESGKVQRIDAAETLQKIGDNAGRLIDTLLQSEDEEATLKAVIRENAAKALDYLHNKGVISDVQYQSAFKDGVITPEAIDDLANIVTETLFSGSKYGEIRTMFNALPDAAKKALVEVMYRDLKSPQEARIKGYVQEAIVAYYAAIQQPEFAAIGRNSTAEQAEQAMATAKVQTNMDNTPTISERFSTFAIKLATLYAYKSKSSLKSLFNHFFDDVQGTNADLFGENAQKTLAQAVKDNFNIDIDNNGRQSNDGTPLQGTGSSSPTGRQERTGKSESRPEGENGTRGTDDSSSSTPVQRPTEHSAGSTGAAGNTLTIAQAAAESAAKAEREALQGRLDSDSLTENDIRNTNIAPELQTAAIDYINGNHTIPNQIAYETAKQNVRLNLQRGATGSANADQAQLGGENTTPTTNGTGNDNRQGGGLDSNNNRTGESEQGNLERQPNSEGNVSVPAGEQGNDSMGSTGAPTDSSDRQRRSSGRGGRTRSNVPDRGGKSNSSRVSNKNAERNDSTADRIADIDNEINELLGGLADDLHNLGRTSNKLNLSFIGLSNDQLESLANITAKSIKLGYLLVAKGCYKFKQWYNQMNKHFGGALRDSGLFSTEEIDQFIRDAWNCKFEYDGVTKTIKDWAAEKSQEELREMVHKSREEKLKEQKEAESVETIVGDADNIRESLPFLFPEQQEDVLKAETQFYDESHKDKEHGNGKGILFTNGTGTGKTFTGLGIVKRFVKQGKGRVLIVTAQDKKIQDWIRDAKCLGIEATQLSNTKDKGSGVVVTQYANMRQNQALLEDEFDLIVYDESHKLLENQDGDTTAAAAMHYQLSNRDLEQATRRQMLDHPLMVEERKLLEERDGLTTIYRKGSDALTDAERTLFGKYNNDITAVRERIDKIDTRLSGIEKEVLAEIKRRLQDPAYREKAQAAVDKTKVVFLSASPFNTAKNLEYVEGYIFSYNNEDVQTNELPSERKEKERDDFVLDKFPSSHKRQNGKVVRRKETQIADPEQASQEEIEFADHLMELGTQSGRMLDSEYDYSREFPILDFEHARAFNMIYEQLHSGRFMPLYQYFKPFLENYAQITAFFEAIKVQSIEKRLQQHIDLGRKVIVFHRRMSTQDGIIIRPISAGLVQAREAGANDLVYLFQQEFAGYIDWEENVDLDFAPYEITRAFSTPEERAAYEIELQKWEEKNATKAKPTPKPIMKTAKVATFNGKMSETAKAEAVKAFNDDNSTTQILVCQVASAKEGIDLHDTTGKYQRAEVNLYLPQSPLEFIQVEGRIYRIGNKSNAVFEYPLLGIDVELSSFAAKINGRSQTSENLALGSMARGLRDSIGRAALGAYQVRRGASNAPSTGQGTGGKWYDNKENQKASTSLNEAIQNYAEWAGAQSEQYTEKQIPDPIGLIMVQLGSTEKGENVLIPLAGTGTVARYVATNTHLLAYEPSTYRYSRLVTLCGGGGRLIHNKRLSIDNSGNENADAIRYLRLQDNIIAFAPATDAREEIEKIAALADKLNNSGRLVLLTTVNNSISNTHNERVLWGEHRVYDNLKVGDNEIENTIIRADIKLPLSALQMQSESIEREGGTELHLLVIDKIDNSSARAAALASVYKDDLSQVGSEQELWDKLQKAQALIPARTIDKVDKTRKRVENLANKILVSSDVFSSKKIRMREDSLFAPRKGYRGHLEISYADITEGNPSYNYYYVRSLAQSWVRYTELINQHKNGTRTLEDSDYEFFDVSARLIQEALGKTGAQIRNLAQGKAADSIDGRMEYKDFRESVEGMLADNPELSELSKHVFDTAEQLGLSIEVNDAAFEGKSKSTQAYFTNAEGGKIYVRSSFINGLAFDSEKKGQVLLHETIHAVTSYALFAYEDGTLSKESPLYQACQDIKEVFDAISSDPEFKQKIKGDTGIDAANNEYGLTNTHEMLAELSNPLFRAALKAKQLWQKLINGIKHILGIDIPFAETTEQGNALSMAERALNTLLDNIDLDLYRSFIARSTNNGNAIELHYEITDPAYAEEQNAADQFATETVLSALGNAGIQVEHVSQEEAERVLGENRTDPNQLDESLGSRGKYDNHSNASSSRRRGGDGRTDKLYQRQPTDTERSRYQSVGDSGSATQLRTQEGVVYGYAQDGKIYLTEQGLNPNTPIHEYTHLWARAMQQKNPAAWQSIVDLLKGTPMWNEVVNDPNYKDLTTDDEIASEVLSRYSGEKGAERFRQEAERVLQDKSISAYARTRVLLNNVREALSKFWNWVGKDLFHIDHFDSIEEVADRVLYDLTNGTDITTDIQDEGKAEAMITPLTPKDGESIAEFAQRNVDYQDSFRIEEQALEYERALHKSGFVEFMEKADRKIFDAARPIMDFQKEFEKKGAILTTDNNAYLDVFRAGARSATAIERYQFRCERPLAQAVRKIMDSKKLNNLGFVWQNLSKDDLKDRKDRKNGTPITPFDLLGIYLQAKDCQEAIDLQLPDRGAAGFENNISLPSESGYENGVPHGKIIEAVESALGQDVVDDLWEKVRACTEYALDYQERRGYIDHDTREKYRRDFYVPERGWLERDMSGMEQDYQQGLGKMYNSPYNAALQQAKGRSSLASNPFAYISSIVMSSIITADSNVTNAHLLQFCLDNQELGLQTDAFRIKKFWTIRTLNEDGSVNPDISVSFAQPTERMYEHDKEVRKKIEAVNKQIANAQRQIANWSSIAKDEAMAQPIRDAANARIAELTKIVADLKTQQKTLYGELCVLDYKDKKAIEPQLTKGEQLQHIVYAVKDGQQYAILFKDVRVANAINKTYRTTGDELFGSNDIFHRATRGLSAMLTQYNPEFAARNFVKDKQTALATLLAEHPQLVPEFEKTLNSALFRHAVLTYLFGLKVQEKEKFSNSDLGDIQEYNKFLEEYFERGAQTGYSYLPDLKVLRSNWEKLINDNKGKQLGRGMLGALSVATEWSETAIRFAAYFSARKNGMEADEAASLSKELTTNFDRGGEWSHSWFFALFSFMRATLNGNLKYWRMLQNGKRGVAGFMGIGAFYFTLGLISNLINPDDPDDNVYASDYSRQNNLIIGKVALGKLLGITGKIPLGHFMVSYYAAGSNAARAIQGDKTWERAAWDTFASFTKERMPDWMNIAAIVDTQDEVGLKTDFAGYAQGAAPTFARPFIDILVNEDYKGHTINNEYDWNENTKDILKYKKGTAQFYIDLQNGIYEAVGGDLSVKNRQDDNFVQTLVDVSPSSLQHVVEGYTGGIGESLLTTGAMIYSVAQGNKPSVDDIPFLRKFFSEHDIERIATQQTYMLERRSENYNALEKSYKPNKEKYNAAIRSEKHKLSKRTDNTISAIRKRIEKGIVNENDLKTLIELNKEWNESN